MTKLSFDNQIIFEEKLEKLNKRPPEDWLRLIYEWVKTDRINFKVFQAFLEYTFEEVLDEAVKTVVGYGGLNVE